MVNSFALGSKFELLLKNKESLKMLKLFILAQLIGNPQNMKILKYLLFLVLIVLIGAAVYFGTQDGTYDIQDSAVIEAPAQVVFNKVNNYKTWEHWGPWKKEDSTMVFTYAEKTSGEGASYSWDGKDMDGSMTTTKVIPNKEIEQDLTLMTPGGERKGKVYWNFEEMENGKTKVTWGMKGEHHFMDKVFYAISGMDFETEMHKMNQTGLTGIADAVVEDMKVFTINVDGYTQYGGGYYMYVTTAVKQSEISEKVSPMIDQVIGYIQENKLNMAGMPFILYNSIDNINNTVIFSACIPIKEKVITPEGNPVLCGFMEPHPTLKTTLKGDYSHIQEAYVKAREYISKNNLVINPSGNMFEVYKTDPEENPNPAEWVTEIYIPLTPVPEPEPLYKPTEQ